MLLLDENLNPKLVGYLADVFPNSSHVGLLGMRGHTDTEIWNLAKQAGYVVVATGGVKLYETERFKNRHPKKAGMEPAGR